MKWLRTVVSLWFGMSILAGTAAAQTLHPVDAGGGALSSPAVHGAYLYVGTGATINVWDMSDPAEPAYVGRTGASPAPGPISSLAVVGDYLYAAWSSMGMAAGITIYSLADPAHPVGAAEYDDYVDSAFFGPVGLVASGALLYLGDAQNGLFVLDTSNPTAPSVIGQASDIYAFDAMAINGTQLLTSGSSFLGGRLVYAIDVSDPTMPSVEGSAELDGGSVLRAVLTDGYAIGVGNDLLVYDTHDGANITQVYATAIEQATGAIRLGDVLYLVGDSGIQVWDFATPTAPSLIRTVAAPTFAPDQTAVTPFGPLVLTHTDRAVLLGTTDPLQPTLAAQFDVPVGVSAHAAGFDGTHAYFAEEGYGLGVADATTLAPVGRYDADLPPYLAARDMEDISVDGGRAYLAAWGYGVLIADLTNPAAPVELGRFEFPFASAIEAHGDRVYVASTTNGGIFKVLDVSNPASPQELGSILTSQTYDLTVRGNHAFLVDGANFGDGGLRIVDISNPSAPTVVGQEQSCPFASGVFVSDDGNTTYVACSSDTTFASALQVIDTTDKTQPLLLGSLALPGLPPNLTDYNDAHSVVVVGDTAYVGNEYGLDEVDVSNPAAPTWMARHDTGYVVRKVELAPDGRVFAFSSVGGVHVFAPERGDAIFADGFDG
ncbi:LVIVD repeat-containing protein [Dokdonella fugitiva]|jgi:hypothetical protein|uniref:LVIVD repeat-containing protein n=1 Tax=Dokdonella fugitiva TaxID=328517 RepID=A0A4R2IB75_9GAMM|nr:hypothetical protein [Dokdonella fugitiva]TCO41754.1 hypothetical protein EV148_102105 [Dokdonella fugitiva]